MKKTRIFSLLLTTICIASQAQAPLAEGFNHPQDSARTKVWWFFGETETTREGITADLEAFKTAGVGGVVYYDQVHGKGEGADKLFDEHWWQSLIFASQEAKRLGLSFEANITNGYAAGGSWITPDKSMQRLVATKRIVTGGRNLSFKMPLHDGGKSFHRDVAVVAIPYLRDAMGDTIIMQGLREFKDDSHPQVLDFDLGTARTVRSICYQTNGRGKSATSTMQVPGPHSQDFFGNGYRALPDLGELQVAQDGIHYQNVARLKPIYTALGTWKTKTIAFPATTGRYFRIRLHDWHSSDRRDDLLRFGNVTLSACAYADRWEEKAALQTEFIEGDCTPAYTDGECLQPERTIDLTPWMAEDGTVTWNRAPEGEWLILRMTAVPTGGRTKHGRPEGLGLECDKLSAEGAEQHWQCYVQPLIDSIRAHGADINGLLIDSHEAGSQNWTKDFLTEFQRIQGYDLRPYLPVMAGYVMTSPQKTDSLLHDIRLTIAQLVGERYFATFRRLCHENQLTLTAQAIGGAVCMPADLISAKQYADVPQSEFWVHQPDGTYDIKECSSAAHIYGKQIASAEAFSDGQYKLTPAYYKQLADYAYAFGLNELVACAGGFQPWSPTGFHAPLRINTYNGREYAFNRLNTFWPYMRGLWDYQARCSYVLRQGKPVSDICVYLGDDAPVRILTHKLPEIPRGYDFDAFTTDALLNRMRIENGRIVLPDGVSYQMMVVPDGPLSPRAEAQIRRFRSQGACIYVAGCDGSMADALRRAAVLPDIELPSDGMYFVHRRTTEEDIYFIDNHQDHAVNHSFKFRTQAKYAELWNPATGQRLALPTQPTTDGRMVANIRFAPRESCFVVFSDRPSVMPIYQPTDKTLVAELNSGWTVWLNPQLGGIGEVVFDTLSDWTKHAAPHIKHYSGTAVYRNTFTLHSKPSDRNYYIRLQMLNGAAEVSVNGKKAGLVWCSPWQIDITHLLKRGSNKIEISYTNSWTNRMIVDASLPESKRITCCTAPLVKPTDELLPAGIISVLIVGDNPNKLN